MAIYIRETGRGFPNVDSGGEYQKVWQRPEYGKYKSHKHHSGPGTNYTITFNDEGPGTSIFGEDKVYYIGDQEVQCVGECDTERVGIHRFYRPGMDHKYSTYQNLRDDDVPDEREKSKVKRGYVKEPRSGAPVFYLARSEKGSRTQPLYAHYEADRNDSLLSTSSNVGNGYVQTGLLGYVYTSAANAAADASANETAVPLYHYFRSTSTEKRDNFYTIDPAAEVNLNGGPIAPKDPHDREYQYQGIIGYVWADDFGSGNVKQIREQGLLGPVGYGSPVDYATRAGWYNWDYDGSGIYTHENYEYQYDADAGPLEPTPIQRSGRNYRYNGSPAVHKHPDFGWGNPTLCPNLNTDAYFEWLYGKNGAVKAAVPRFLEFHSAFDSQFVYYIYDTSYPWKGPIFSIQYALSDRHCCPNQSVTVDEDDTCVCNESLLNKSYHSHFYEIREDSWRTTRTRLDITQGSGAVGVADSFKPVDTDTKRIFFRYLSREGTPYQEGDTINGWEISEVAYFGNKLRCGYMELTGDGDKFSAGQQFTTPVDPDNETILPSRTAEVLAGYGITDRAGYFGVYEFPKRISYYKVEIDRTALVNKQSLDLAEIECTVDKNGRISDVEIINGGKGYINPRIVIEEPAQLTEGGANDHAREQLRQLGEWEGAPLRSPTNKLDNPDGRKYNFTQKKLQRNIAGQNKKVEKAFDKRENVVPYSEVSDIQIDKADRVKGEDGGVKRSSSTGKKVYVERERVRTMSAEHRRKGKFKQAVVEIVSLNKEGGIEEILIKNRGQGYDPDPNRRPKVWVVQVEEEQYKFRGPNTKKMRKKWKNVVDPSDKTDITETAIDGIKGETRRRSGAAEGEISIMDDGVIGSFKSMMQGFTQSYPTGYIRFSGTDEVEKTSLCSNLPPACVGVEIPSIVGKALFKPETVEGLISASGAFKSVMENQYPDMVRAAEQTDQAADNLSSLYGWNGNQQCISLPQPKFYNVTRLADLPCPFTDAEDGRDYGWVIYKYCGSDSDNAHFNVSLSVEGETKGSQGADFMEFLQKLPRPNLTPPRPVMNGGDKRKMWKCSRQNIKGRCYWDPSGGNDVVFVPVGLDENTFDWSSSDFDEADQLSLWMGDNFDRTTKAVGYTIPGTPGTPGSGTEGDPDYEPPTPGTPDEDFDVQTFNIIKTTPLTGGVPTHECWDTYLRHSGNSNGVLDVYSAYYIQGSGSNQTQGKTAGTGFWGNTRLYNGESCPFSPCTYTVYSNYGSTGFTGSAIALEYVNDVSIAIDPRLISQRGMKMGPYTGTLNIKNWATGATIAFGQAVQNMGNPFYNECSGGAFGNLVEAVQPNPPIARRKVHTSSYDPGDIELVKKQQRFKNLKDLEFEGSDTGWEEYYDEDFDFDADVANTAISDFSTNTDRLFD